MRKLTSEEFVERSKKTHDNKYDYSKVEYENLTKKVSIICPIHGIFFQAPGVHFKSGCPKCSSVKNTLYTKNEFVKKANEKHLYFYNYSKVKYINNKTKITIICPIHGEFNQQPKHHLRGSGCSKCAVEKNAKKLRVDREYYLNKFKEIYEDKYDYSSFKYENPFVNINVICRKHGSFFVSPNNHLNKKSGCPKCASSKGENEIESFLVENKILFERQKSFNKCYNKKKLFFDFFLPEYDILIEYDGEQHFKPIKFFGGVDSFTKRKLRDKIKNEFAKENNYNIIRISYIDDIKETLKGKLNARI
jgi:very-short-patch-repair endonuclease